MDASVEKDCTVLEGLFHQIILDMKNSFAVWEDFSSKGSRLHTALKTSMLCLNAFLESFQKVADMASGTRGATKDIGSALTRLCLRQRSIEGKMKSFTNSIMESMVVPMMERMEDWKKNLIIMDREHTRENKRGHQEVKKSHTEAQKEHKKLKKSGGNKQEGMEKLYKSTNEKLLQLRENEMNAVRGALIEERHRLCLFVACLKPVMDEEISLLSDVTHLQEIVENLCLLAGDPDSLPATGEQVICDTIGRGVVMTSSTISTDQTPSLKCQQSLANQQQQQKSESTNQQRSSSSSRQHSMESPSSELSQESSVSDSFSSSATSPSKANRTLQAAINQSKSSDSTTTTANKKDSFEKHGGARIVSIECKPVDHDRNRTLPSSPPVTTTTSPSPHNCPQLLAHHRNPSTSSMASTKEIRYLDPSSLIGCRPHTISYVRDRSYTRPLITTETYAVFEGCVSQRSGQSNGSPYAVPCVAPKRRSTQVGSEKVADIYARPSLVHGHGGYRTPNIKPLPVATPTVPDSGNVPAFPITGYVNMNQLANLSLHQSTPMVKKDTTMVKRDITNRDSMPDFESLRLSHKHHQMDQLQQSASMMIGCEERTGGRDHRRQISLDANQMAKLSEPCVGIDLKSLALRLKRACHLGPPKGSKVTRSSSIPNHRQPRSAILIFPRNSFKVDRVPDSREVMQFSAKPGLPHPKPSGHKVDGLGHNMDGLGHNMDDSGPKMGGISKGSEKSDI